METIILVVVHLLRISGNLFRTLLFSSPFVRISVAVQAVHRDLANLLAHLKQTRSQSRGKEKTIHKSDQISMSCVKWKICMKFVKENCIGKINFT